MKRETLQYLVQAFNCASDDATRWTMNHVELKAIDGRVRIQATTGHALSVVFVSDDDLIELIKNDPVYFSRESLTGLKHILKESKRLLDVPATMTDKILSIGASVVVKSEKDIAGEFPDTSKLAPTYPDDAFVFGFDAVKLVLLVKAMQSRPDSFVRLRVKGKLDPIEVTVDGNVGLLMPCRV